MIHIVILLFFYLFSPVVVAFGAVPTESSSSPTIDLTQPLHFLSSTDEDVIVAPGEYQVEAADEWLKLIPAGGERKEALLIQAIPGDHQDEVAAPQSIFEFTKENPDLHYLVLLLPDGTGLEAMGSVSGIRPRRSNLFYLRASKRSYRSSSFTVRKPPRRSRTNRPVDCGPFVNDLKGKYHTNPAIASFKGKLHLVTRYSGPNLPFRKNPKNNKLWHATYDGKRWSTARQLKNHSSKTRVALATFENRLHMVFLGASSNALRHSTYNGRRWTFPKKIPNQSSKNTPALASFKGILYMFYWQHKTNKLMYSSYTPKNKWKFAKEHFSSSVDIKIPPTLLADNDELNVIRSSLKRGVVSITRSPGKTNNFGDFMRPSFPPGTWVNTKFKKMKAISGTMVKGPKKPTTFIMLLNESNELFYTNFRNIRFSRFQLKATELPFLNQKSKTTAALAHFDRCIHTVFVQKSSGKLRHVKFDEARLK